jgi:hypothetical protein
MSERWASFSPSLSFDVDLRFVPVRGWGGVFSSWEYSVEGPVRSTVLMSFWLRALGGFCGLNAIAVLLTVGMVCAA